MGTPIKARDRLVAIAEVQAMLGVGKATIYRWIEKADFPKALKLGPQVRRWRKGDIEQWVASRDHS
jgi:predicted DNA-binding transcriptional regulator AlpA